MIRLFRLFLVFTALCLSSCQHGGAKILETPMSFNEIRRVVSEVMGDPRKVSEGGYELDSKYHDSQGKVIDNPGQARERYFTRVSILGDRRPYDLWVRVFAEVRTAQGFEGVGEDDQLAERLASDLRKALHESRDKRNLIDDFKAF